MNSCFTVFIEAPSKNYLWRKSDDNTLETNEIEDLYRISSGNIAVLQKNQVDSVVPGLATQI